LHPDDRKTFENMQRLTLLLLTGCALQLCAAAASAEMRQFANMVYELPNGWEPNGETDGRLELRYEDDDDRCDNCRILIDSGAEGGGPVQEWRDAVAAPGKNMSVVGDPQLRQDSIGEWPVEVMLRQIEDDGRAKFQAYFAIDLPTRNELIIFEGSARDEETFNRSLAMLNDAIPPMLNGLRFISEGADPVLGPPEPGDLEGPWFGTAIRNQYNGLSGTLDLVVDKRLMTFYADGRFFRGIPPTGAGPLDFEGLVTSDETGVGNYVVVNGEVELRFADGGVSRMRIINDSTIDAGRVDIYPAKFPPDGFRFAGVIQSASYTAFGPGIAGGVGSESTQVFRRDGTYTDSSFTGAFGSFDSGGGFTTTTEQPEQSGHYEVAAGLITLTPPEGESQTTWIILEGEDSVIIGGQAVSASDDE
jgi:hypothetical protein